MSTPSAKERIAYIASRQCGRITFAQLRAVDASGADIRRWLTQGYLAKMLPRVYAVGHTAPDRRADLWAAVLYAGPGAAVSHATAAHLYGLIDFPPSTIEVSTPRRSIRSIPRAVRVYSRHDRPREPFGGIPATLVPDTMLDLAATSTDKIVSRAVRQLDRRGELDLKALDAVCGRGRPGSKRLRKALQVARPTIGFTNSELEQLFLELSRKWKIPEPRCNVYVAGVPVDAYWPDHKLVVETDGGDDHASVAQMHHDRANELTLRAHGLTVIRYDRILLKAGAQAVHDDLLAQLKRAVPLHRA
jgi:hypothetical protein